MKMDEATRLLDRYQIAVLSTHNATEAAQKSGSLRSLQRAMDAAKEKVSLGNQIIDAMTCQNPAKSTPLPFPVRFVEEAACVKG